MTVKEYFREKLEAEKKRAEAKMKIEEKKIAVKERQVDAVLMLARALTYKIQKKYYTGTNSITWLVK
jgi:hypothetical protein